MFFVYCGYVSPDHCDSSYSPTYKLLSFNNEQEVLKYKVEFDENINSDCDNVIFRVFKGTELNLKPVEKVTEWKLE